MHLPAHKHPKNQQEKERILIHWMPSKPIACIGNGCGKKLRAKDEIEK